MKRILIAAAATAFALTVAQPVPAQDLASSIVGVWKIKSFERKEIATGNLSKPFGENPNGMIIYTKGGHFSSNGFAEGRKVPTAPAPADAERIELHKTMYAFSGSYKVEGGASTATVTSSWNQAWTGQVQKRPVKIEGNLLTVVTGPFMSPGDGVEIVLTSVFERLE